MAQAEHRGQAETAALGEAHALVVGQESQDGEAAQLMNGARALVISGSG